MTSSGTRTRRNLRVYRIKDNLNKNTVKTLLEQSERVKDSKGNGHSIQIEENVFDDRASLVSNPWLKTGKSLDSSRCPRSEIMKLTNLYSYDTQLALYSFLLNWVFTTTQDLLSLA